jgi:hypothetical protein
MLLKNDADDFKQTILNCTYKRKMCQRLATLLVHLIFSWFNFSVWGKPHKQILKQHTVVVVVVVVVS